MAARRMFAADGRRSEYLGSWTWRAERNAKSCAACSSQLHTSLRSNLYRNSQIAIDIARAPSYHLTCLHLAGTLSTQRSSATHRIRPAVSDDWLYCVACARSACASLAYRAGRHILQTCVTRLVTRYCSLHRLNLAPRSSNATRPRPKRPVSDSSAPATRCPTCPPSGTPITYETSPNRWASPHSPTMSSKN